jgi:hypothetical protein
VTSVYRPAPLHQINPDDPLGPYSCTAYSAAMALDRATMGGVQVPGWLVRQRTGKNPNPDGLTLQDVQKALETWNVPLHIKTGSGWPNVLASLRSFEGVILQGHYPALTAAGFTCQASFKGNHAVYVNSLDSLGTSGLTYDPLCLVARWIPIAALQAYAIGLAPTVYFATTRSTPLVAA